MPDKTVILIVLQTYIRTGQSYNLTITVQTYLVYQVSVNNTCIGFALLEGLQETVTNESLKELVYLNFAEYLKTYQRHPTTSGFIKS